MPNNFVSVILPKILKKYEHNILAVALNEHMLVSIETLNTSDNLRIIINAITAACRTQKFDLFNIFESIEDILDIKPRLDTQLFISAVCNIYEGSASLYARMYLQKYNKLPFEYYGNCLEVFQKELNVDAFFGIPIIVSNHSYIAVESKLKKFAIVYLNNIDIAKCSAGYRNLDMLNVLYCGMDSIKRIPGRYDVGDYFEDLYTNTSNKFLLDRNVLEKVLLNLDIYKHKFLLAVDILDLLSNLNEPTQICSVYIVLKSIASDNIDKESILNILKIKQMLKLLDTKLDFNKFNLLESLFDLSTRSGSLKAFEYINNQLPDIDNITLPNELYLNSI